MFSQRRSVDKQKQLCGAEAAAERRRSRSGGGRGAETVAVWRGRGAEAAVERRRSRCGAVAERRRSRCGAVTERRRLWSGDGPALRQQTRARRLAARSRFLIDIFSLGARPARTQGDKKVVPSRMSSAHPSQSSTPASKQAGRPRASTGTARRSVCRRQTMRALPSGSEGRSNSRGSTRSAVSRASRYARLLSAYSRPARRACWRITRRRRSPKVTAEIDAPAS